MKTKILLYSIVAILGLTAVFAFKQNSKTDSKSVVMIRVIEQTYTAGGTRDPKIYIIENGKFIKSVDLQKSNDDKKLAPNYEQISSIITEYINNGYEIKSSIACPYYINLTNTFSEYILVK